MAEDVKAQVPLAPAEIVKIQAASVQKFDDSSAQSLLIYFATATDDTPRWWSPSRDKYLREFWPLEPYLAGALYSICARNASFKFAIEGPPRQVRRVERLLAQMGFGAGWQVEMMKVSLDILTQDNGAFIEVIRPARITTKEGTFPAVKTLDAGNESQWYLFDDRGRPKMLKGLDYEVRDSPYDNPVGLAHLDAARCTRTGDPTYPVVYTDIKGFSHKMAFWQVITFEDMPSPQTDMNGVGYCAVTRVISLARTLRDMQLYKSEKIGGRFNRAIHLTNAGKAGIERALAEQETRADSSGLMRYVQPLIVSSMDPTVQISLKTIELASLPEGFSEEETLKWYIAGLALGTGVDYGFLAPLPGRGIGTGSESEVQERSAKGKSSRLFMRCIETKFNYNGVLPRSCTLSHGEIDPEEESLRDEAADRRATTRQIRITSGEITPEIARMIAFDDGDLKQEYLDILAASPPEEESDEEVVVDEEVTDEPEPTMVD